MSNTVKVAHNGNLVANDNGLPVQLTGSKVAEIKDQSNAVAGVLTFSANITALGIYNADTISDGVFAVNGINIPVPAGLTFKDLIGGTPGATVTITGSTKYIVSRYV